jgi:Zn-dependent protease with chaperone function
MAVNDREGGMANLFGTHPPIGRRIAILESMAGVTGSPPQTG